MSANIALGSGYLTQQQWGFRKADRTTQLVRSNGGYSIRYTLLEADDSTRDVPTWAVKFIVTPSEQCLSLAVTKQQVHIDHWRQAAES